jgi:hypothetical protein
MPKHKTAATAPPVTAQSEAPNSASNKQPHSTATPPLRQDPQAEQLRERAELARAQGDRLAYWSFRRAMLLRQAQVYTRSKEVS